MRKTDRHPVSYQLTVACLSNGTFFKGRQKFHCHSNCEIYAVYRDEKLAVPHISADEGWKTDILCPHGDARYHVSGKDLSRNKYNHRVQYDHSTMSI